MILTKIWERYFIKQALKVFFLFLFCFYGLYIVVDYASHTSALPHHQTQIPGQELIRYYLFIFASRAEILIPFALLIAVIKTLLTLNTHQELVALLASGVSLKRLMRPFILLGLVCTALLFLNEQFLMPQALKKLRHIEDSNKNSKRRHHPEIAVNPVVLADESLLLFQSYDITKEEFFDVFWVRSIDDIYRMTSLTHGHVTPQGKWVDHFVRQPNGELAQVAAHELKAFPDLHFNEKALQSTFLDPDALKITELWSQLPVGQEAANEKESKLLTSFYWKMMIPWLCLLAVIAPIPFCVRFSRQLPIFLIYVCGVFGLVAFYLLMDATLIIAKRQVLAPLWAIGVPFGAAFAVFGWRYLRMR